MIDIASLRKNPEIYRKSQKRRGKPVQLVDDVLMADKQHREYLRSFEVLRAKQKSLGKQLSGNIALNERQPLIVQTKDMAKKIKNISMKVNETFEKYIQLLYQLDNLVDDNVPDGKANNFEIIKIVGEKPKFNFKLKDHLSIGEAVDGIDMERGVKISGSRFYFLKGDIMMLEQSIINLALQRATSFGFTPMTVPTLVRPSIMKGTGFLDEHSNEIYYLSQDDMYLVGTSEVALAGYHADEIINVSKPKRYSGLSTCYRREAGSYGKDVRGIIRVHQFNKLEMFSYVQESQASLEHEYILKMQEDMLLDLEIPYRVINTAASDLGSSAIKKFDCEAWLPSRNEYCELTSASNCGTFQARRLNIRERTEKETKMVATLNGTLATTRWLVALLEVHQKKNFISIPSVLQPFMGKEKIEFC